MCVCVSDCVRESENMLREKGKKIVFQIQEEDKTKLFKVLLAN